MTQAKIWSESPIIRLKLRAQFGARAKAARLLGLYCNSSVSVEGKTKVADRRSSAHWTALAAPNVGLSGCEFGPFFGLARLGYFCDIAASEISLN